ncbi:ABC transporter permease [candidate division CSSED10-310 bacterium]|uniref:Transport permease protein n=1 Tax=candidate division CSSED10-310 bacterium TaxID=2855610 RepID=A0ABV6YWR9_UNCC1
MVGSKKQQAFPTREQGKGLSSGMEVSLDLPGIAWTLVRTDFKTRYYGSVLGFLWTLLNPIIIFVTLVTIFSFLFSSHESYGISLIIGLFIWDYFSEGSATGLMSLFTKGYLATKVKFPSWLLIATSSSNALLRLMVFSVSIMIYVMISRGFPGLDRILLYLLYMICLYFMVLGISLTTSLLFLWFRDLNQIWAVILQAGFFVAPIIYPLEILPEKYHFYLYLWPPTVIIQFSRAILLAYPVPTLTGHLCLVSMTMFIFIIGFITYRFLHYRAVERL